MEVRLLACKVFCGLLVLMVVWCELASLLLFLGVIICAVSLYRYVKRRCDVKLPSDGKVVLITGCDTGIGHETAVACSQTGLTVIACCLDDTSSGAKALASLGNVHVIKLDVTSDDNIKDVLLPKVKAVCGQTGLWAVVNNAGFTRQAPVELTSMETFLKVSDVMLFGTVRVTKALLPLIRRAKGRVVTMSSDRGMLTPALSSAYCIAKHGVETFSDVLRAEMSSFGVSVSIIQPGHFGAATAIIDEQALKAIRASLEKDVSQVSAEVQQAYGGVEELIDSLLHLVENSRKTSAKNVRPVVDAILHAVLSERPQNRYPVHGSTSFVDPSIVLGQARFCLPESAFNILQSFVMGILKK